MAGIEETNQKAENQEHVRAGKEYPSSRGILICSAQYMTLLSILKGKEIGCTRFTQSSVDSEMLAELGLVHD